MRARLFIFVYFLRTCLFMIVLPTVQIKFFDGYFKMKTLPGFRFILSALYFQIVVSSWYSLYVSGSSLMGISLISITSITFVSYCSSIYAPKQIPVYLSVTLVVLALDCHISSSSITAFFHIH